jgi:hypothetical protein
MPYRWTGNVALGDITPADLPLLEASVVGAITEALIPFGYQPEPVLPDGEDRDLTPHRELNELALANLAAWVPALGLYRCHPARGGYEAVPIWRPSTTGRPREQRHRNLKISRLGIRDFGADQGYTPLDLVMTARECDLEEAFLFLAEKLGLRDETEIIALEPDPAPAVIQSEPEVNQLEAFTYCPGVVGEIIDFICATGRRPNRVLALATAITVVGTLIGRRVAGPTESATHLYAVAIGPTGCGKQHLLNSAMTLMTAAGAGGHLGPGEFMSMSAIISHITRKPLSLCVADEYGAFIARATHKKASSHETALSKILRTLWGTSFAPMAGLEWAQRELKAIQCPALSILGVSTADEFQAALQGDSVNNGFLNRHLMLESNLRSDDRDPEANLRQIPDDFRHRLRRLYEWTDPSKLMSIDDPEAVFEPEILPWTDDAAQASYFEFVRACDEYMDEHAGTKPYLARCSEIAVRLATIRAAGMLEHGGCVTKEDMEWGADIAWTAGQSLVAAAMNYTPGNERRNWYEKILGFVERRLVVKTRDIQQHIHGALRSPEIKDILGQLVEAGHIVKTKDGYKKI